MPGVLISYLRSRWLLLLVLLVFIACKLPHLHYPFYIDEGWVYAPAVKQMAVHGPSLAPGAISSDLSRGHPLMFHFLGAIWIKCFGQSHIAMHAYPLLLSLLTLIALYEGCMLLFGKTEAALALLITATRAIFFVQSSFVYPEVLLALLGFLSLYFYSRDKLLLTSLTLFLLFFTKEAGLVFGVVAGFDAMTRLFRKGESSGVRWLRLGAVLAPTCLIAIFFIVQKAKLGWYVLPEHTGLIKANWNDYYIMLRRGIYWTFRGDHAMDLLVIFIILLSLVPAVKQREARYLFLLPPAIMVYILADNLATGHTGSAVLTLLFLTTIGSALYFILRLNATMNVAGRRFTVLAGASVVLFLLYSSLTEIGYRYLLAAVILIIVLLAVSLATFINNTAQMRRPVLVIAIAGIALTGAYGFLPDERTEDTSPGAYDAMDVQLKSIAFLEKEQAYDKEVAFGWTMEDVWMTDTTQGFLNTAWRFTNTRKLPVGPHTEYAILGNTCGNRDDNRLLPADPNFHLVYRVQTGKIWAEIYKRK